MSTKKPKIKSEVLNLREYYFLVVSTTEVVSTATDAVSKTTVAESVVDTVVSTDLFVQEVKVKTIIPKININFFM